MATYSLDKRLNKIKKGLNRVAMPASGDYRKNSLPWLTHVPIRSNLCNRRNQLYFISRLLLQHLLITIIKTRFQLLTTKLIITILKKM
jgi:hypothetical protein